LHDAIALGTATGNEMPFLEKLAQMMQDHLGTVAQGGGQQQPVLSLLILLSVLLVLCLHSQACL
jgi:hypothetical protein